MRAFLFIVIENQPVKYLNLLTGCAKNVRLSYLTTRELPVPNAVSAQTKWFSGA